MRCRYCGYEIPKGELYCERCGKEVQMVPDYNPLDDVLAAQVRGAIDGTQAPLDDYDYEKTYTSDLRRVQERQRRTNPGQHTRAGRSANTGRTTNPGRNTNTGRNTRPGVNTRNGARNVSGGRKQQEARKKAKRRKQKKRLILMILLTVVLLGILGFFLYRNSYTGQVKRGYKAAGSQEYDKAAGFFKTAIKKNPQKAEAYVGLSKIYLEKDNQTEAEDMFLNAIDKYPEDVLLYEACIQFYMDTKQPEEVSVLLKDAGKEVRTQLKEYVSKGPEFSLDDKETFEDVQQLTLKSDGKAIYYTTDGSAPTTSSKKYTGPIQLKEGKTTIRAISVNKKGIPSLPVEKDYEVELPMVDAPAVTPSTGQYSEATQIVIQVPDGYTAYYTMDKSQPTEKSQKYTGPIDMPQGTTIFKAVLVNGKGRLSGVTTRNYELSN